MVDQAIFLDRDGVLNELVNRGTISTAPWDIKELKIYDEAKEAVLRMKKLGYLTFVVTNQPDVRDGKMTQKQLAEINHKIKIELGVDLIVCALKRQTQFYKPNNMMLEQLIQIYNLDHTKCFMIGDRWKDIVCGYTTGVTTIFVGDKYECPIEYEGVKPDYITKNVLTACYIIEENT